MMFNAAVCVLLAACVGWVVLDPRIHEGLVVRLGLVCMALGFAAMAATLATAVDAEGLRVVGRAAALVHLGLVVSVVGFVWRFRVRGWFDKPPTDWGVLDETRSGRP